MLASIIDEYQRLELDIKMQYHANMPSDESTLAGLIATADGKFCDYIKLRWHSSKNAILIKSIGFENEDETTWTLVLDTGGKSTIERSQFLGNTSNPYDTSISICRELASYYGKEFIRFGLVEEESDIFEVCFGGRCARIWFNLEGTFNQIQTIFFDNNYAEKSRNVLKNVELLCYSSTVL